MLDPESERDPVEVLAAEFLERRRQAEHPTIDEYVARHPQWADRIRELFPAALVMEELKVCRTRASSDGRVCSGPDKLEQLGDFRILSEIGRGGMGIVYKAEQISLGRHVAVKILPKQALLDPKHLRRFQREARTVASLHHTNIVPVFGVGQQDGYHYFVMQYIPGVGLDKVLVELKRLSQDNENHDSAPKTDGSEAGPTAQSEPPARQRARSLRNGSYWRHVAKIGLQVARALEYAHSQGTLHRDIKPANLLIDSQNVVWVADFGLAKAAEQDEVSRTDDVIGTLRYMAPERFQGDADARSDLYSLGLALYELLTLQPAFDRPDRSNLIQEILHGTPPAPRKIVPRVPRDLETIVLKATAREPRRRYQTADQLATDLECYLGNRPIMAQRLSAVERAWRWCERNRAVAALTATALSLLVLVAIVATLGYVSTRKALVGETLQRHKAEATSQLATEALDRIYGQFAPNRLAATTELTIEDAEGEEHQLPIQPVLSNEAAALLENMLVFYDRLADQGINTASFRRKAAEANRRVGDIRQRLGQFDRAERAYRRALAIYEGLRPDATDAADSNTEIARIQNELGNIHGRTSQPEKARVAHQKALRILRSIPAPRASRPDVCYELARTYYDLGRTRPRHRRGPPRATRKHRGGPPVVKDATDATAGNKPSSMATNRTTKGRTPTTNATPRRPPRAGRGPSGTDNLEKAIEILERLVAQQSDVPDYQQLLARCYRTLAIHWSRRDKDRAAEARHKATAILERLVRDFPDVADYRYDLSETYALSGAGMRAPRRASDPAAEQRLRSARTLAEALVAEHPNVPDYAASLARINYRLGGILEHTGRRNSAQQRYAEAVRLQSSLVERFPNVLSYVFQLAWSQESLARLLRHRGHLDEARAMLEESIANLNRVLRVDGNLRFVNGLLSQSYKTLAEVLKQAGQEDLAAAAAKKADQLRVRRSRRHGPLG